MKYLLSFVFLFASLVAVGQTYSKDLEKAAKKGDVVAQRDLGICYLTGIKVDNQKAFEWLCQAATSQDAQAQYYLGVMFEDGKADLTKDKKGYYANLLRTLDSRERQTAQTTPALLWYLKAASGNNDQAMLKLAYLSRDQKDEGSAMRYFKMAADLGNSEAQSEYQAFVGKLAASGISVTDKDLIIASNVGTQQYMKDEHERIIILNTVSQIGYGAFEFAKAKEIVFQEGDNLLTIETSAFGFGDRHHQWPRTPKEIIFNRPVRINNSSFSSCCPDLLVFNKDVEYIGEGAFGEDKGVKKVVFKKVPKKLDRYFIKKSDYDMNCDEIIIPEGTESAFVNLGISRKKLFEDIDTPLRYSVLLDKPNSLLSILPVNKLSHIDTLTIAGIMFETDLQVLKGCKNLRYLDLSNAYITYSPEALQAQEEGRKFAAALASYMSSVADLEYLDYQMNTSNYLQAKAFVNGFGESAKATKAETGCIVPRDALRDMPKLETVILPLRASKIEDNVLLECKALKTIKLPPYLREIGQNVLEKCESLEQLDIPSTVSVIGKGFAYKTNVSKFDFSKCVVGANYLNSWDFYFIHEPKEIHLPAGSSIVSLETQWHTKLGALYVPASVTRVNYICNIREVHCISPNPPAMNYKGGSVKDITFYIPKGSTTAYYAKYGEGNKYIEE